MILWLGLLAAAAIGVKVYFDHHEEAIVNAIAANHVVMSLVPSDHDAATTAGEMAVQHAGDALRTAQTPRQQEIATKTAALTSATLDVLTASMRVMRAEEALAWSKSSNNYPYALQEEADARAALDAANFQQAQVAAALAALRVAK